MAVSGGEGVYTSTPITKDCKSSISDKFKIPSVILDAYLLTEGAPSGHIRENSNKTWDIGPMQINSANWEGFYNKFGVKPVQLRYNGCLNLMAGAYLIRERLDRAGEGGINSWEDLFFTMASYHSYTPKINAIYQEKWINNLNNLLERDRK